VPPIIAALKEALTGYAVALAVSDEALYANVATPLALVVLAGLCVTPLTEKLMDAPAIGLFDASLSVACKETGVVVPKLTLPDVTVKVRLVLTFAGTKFACAVVVLFPTPAVRHAVVLFVPLAALDQSLNRKPAGSVGIVTLKKFALPRPRLALVLPVTVTLLGKLWPCPPATVVQAESV
jgi:hypothetical protein